MSSLYCGSLKPAYGGQPAPVRHLHRRKLRHEGVHSLDAGFHALGRRPAERKVRANTKALAWFQLHIDTTTQSFNAFARQSTSEPVTVACNAQRALNFFALVHPSAVQVGWRQRHRSSVLVINLPGPRLSAVYVARAAL